MLVYFLIIDSNCRIIVDAAAFRFQEYYVNLMLSLIYSVMLQSLNLRGVAELDVIFNLHKFDKSKT